MPSKKITLSKNQIDKIKTWINNADIKGANRNDMTWVSKEHAQIANFINKYKHVNTKKSHYSVLAAILKQSNKTDEYKKYSEISSKLHQDYQKEGKKQKLKHSRESSWMTWDELLEKRKKMKERFDKDKTDVKANLQYLMISLYTYQPPIRMDYKDMLLHDSRDPPPLNNKNYLWKHKGKYTLVLNADKKAKTDISILEKKGKDKTNFKRGEILIESDTLIEILNKSFEKYPREYVLTTLRDKKKPMGKQNFERLMKDIFKPNNMSVDLLRSMYVTHFYNQKHTLAEKEELATKMRHTKGVAEASYQKHNIKKEDSSSDDSSSDDSSSDDSSSDDSSSDDSSSGEKPKSKGRRGRPANKSKPKPRSKTTKTTGKKPYNHSETMKKYREKNKESIKEKDREYYRKNKKAIGRNKTLYMLNTGNIKKPKSETLKKYNINFDKRSKTWK